MTVNVPSQDIKFNCDVSDAQYWGHFSICGLLLRYRDLYRCEQGLSPWSPVPRAEVAAWIARKEARWPELEGQPFRELEAAGRCFSPFDSTAVNNVLLKEGWAYGAGYGMYLKPTFFLARVRSLETVSGHQVIITDQEAVRDLFSAPAMLQERTIFLRLDPLKALLWDKYAELGPRCPPGLADAFRAYGLAPGRAPDASFGEDLDRVAMAFGAVLLRHELAESAEAVPGWKDALAAAGDRKAEHFLRSVNDLVADTAEAGPLHFIVRSADRGALGLMAGLLDGFRRHLFPELRDAYYRILATGDWESVEKARTEGFERFRALRQRVLDLSGGGAGGFRAALGAMMRSLEQEEAGGRPH